MESTQFLGWLNLKYNIFLNNLMVHACINSLAPSYFAKKNSPIILVLAIDYADCLLVFRAKNSYSVMILKILLGLWLPSDGWLSYGLISVAFTLQSRFFIYLKVFFDFNIFVILVIYYLIALSLSRPVSLCIFSFHFLISFVLLNLLVYWYIRVSITEYHFKRSNKFNKSTVV